MDGSSGAKALAGVEQQLAGAYAGALSRTEAAFAPALGALQARLAQLLARMSPARLDAVERACAVEHARLRAQSRSPLIAQRRTERHGLRALRAFRLQHGLTREAHYPESRALHYSALAFVCVAEAVANTFAFAEGSELGWAGGFMSALLIATTNVAFAFFAGRAITALFHRRLSIKALGALIAGAWVGFEGLYALGVAHYRMALVDNADTAAAMALESLRTLPLAIGDMVSVLLTVFTVAFGVAALLTGLATDDRYPGYGAVHRAWERGRARLAALRRHTLGALDAVFLPAPARLRDITQDALSVQDACRTTVEATKRHAGTLEHALGEVNAAYCASLLKARAAFARVSGITVASSEPAALRPGELLPAVREHIGQASAQIREFPGLVARHATERAAIEARIQRAHERALASMPEFFALTEALAEHESDHDEADTARSLARQRVLWEGEMEQADGAVTQAAPAQQTADEPNDASAAPRAKPTRKSNGDGRTDHYA